jgi:hypothetical protein
MSSRRYPSNSANTESAWPYVWYRSCCSGTGPDGPWTGSRNPKPERNACLICSCSGRCVSAATYTRRLSRSLVEVKPAMRAGPRLPRPGTGARRPARAGHDHHNRSLHGLRGTPVTAVTTTSHGSRARKRRSLSPSWPSATSHCCTPGSRPGPPHLFRTAELVLFHAASCRFRYSSWASCGVR